MNRLAIDGGTPELAPALTSQTFVWPPQDQSIHAALEAAWQSGDWGRYDGHWTARLRDELSAMHEGAEVLLCSSGTIGVELALRGLGLGAGDEVALAGYDFPGNFRAVESVGARPVLVDIDPGTWCISAQELEAAVGESTRAVIVSHLHGGIADLTAIDRICRARGIAIVEDVCQAPGAVRDHKRLGCWGDVAIWSFGGSKLLTAGRGGAVFSKRPDVMQRIRVYSERGNQAFPMSELQACVLVPQFEKLDQQNRQRLHAVQWLTAALAPAKWLVPLTPMVADESRAYYKTAWRYAPSAPDASAAPNAATAPKTLTATDRSPAAGAPSRDQFVAAVRAEGVPLDAGFRGFAQRSERRCRKAGPLPHSQLAAESTVILHHPILLASDAILTQAAGAVLKVGAAWNLDRSRDGN